MKGRLSTYQRDDDFAIRMRLVVVRGLQGLPNDTVVVDFAIDGQSQGAIIVDQGLGTGVFFLFSKEIPDVGSLAGYVPTPTILRRSWARTARISM
jgi:hypothetical protein